jgi:hypothetical protein
MLPVTVSDETGSLDTIAFSLVAEDLVEQNTYLTSQNMKIDSLTISLHLTRQLEKQEFFTLEQVQVHHLILLSNMC